VSFTHNDIALAFSRGEAISFTVQGFFLAVEASAVEDQLDFELLPSIHALSNGATFSGNRLAGNIGFAYLQYQLVTASISRIVA